MAQSALRVNTHLHDVNRMAPTTGETAVPFGGSTYEQYVHPFTEIPEVSQPQFDTRFHSLAQLRAKRIDDLFNLAVLTVAEKGAATRTTDNWLAQMRQNVRDISDTLGETDRERASMIGLVASYLASDTTQRESAEAEVYKIRVERAEDDADNSYMSGTPYRAAHLAIKHSLAELAGDPYEVAVNTADTLPTDTESPQFTHAKAKALFGYASTMKSSDEKRALLLEAMKYADETFARADGEDSMLRGSALHLLSRSLYDASYIPHSFSKQDKINAELAKQARNFAVELLQRSTLEFQTAYRKGVVTPQDTSKQWKAQTELDNAYDEARYFVDIYGNTVRREGIYMSRTPDIQSFIARGTALRFDHGLVKLSAQFGDSGSESVVSEPEHAAQARESIAA